MLFSSSDENIVLNLFKNLFDFYFDRFIFNPGLLLNFLSLFDSYFISFFKVLVSEFYELLSFDNILFLFGSIIYKFLWLCTFLGLFGILGLDTLYNMVVDLKVFNLLYACL